MKITRIDSNIVESKTEKRKEVAKKTIRECVTQGTGTYEIVDDEKVFLHNKDMKCKMEIYAMEYNYKKNKYKRKDWLVKVATKNKNEKVFVVVKDDEKDTPPTL